MNGATKTNNVNNRKVGILVSANNETMTYTEKRRRSFQHRPFKAHIKKSSRETNWKLNRDGLTKTETENEIETPAPEEIREEKNRSVGVNLGNPAVSVGVQGSYGNATTKKYPKETNSV